MADGTAAASPDRIADVEAVRLRGVFGRFATGVVAVTAISPQTRTPTGLTANSFTSVSLDPPLVAFCVAHTSSTWPGIRQAGRIGVNILAASQREIGLQLAAKGGDKFAGLGWTESPGGSPLIDGALAWLECSVAAEHTAGDHVIVVSRVHHLGTRTDGEPLVFYRGVYGQFAP